MSDQLSPDHEGTPDHGQSPGDYEVGYRRPPRQHRFQPGKSGNPKGRPKGAKGLKAELKEELDELVPVTVNGKTKRMRKRRVVIKALTQQAAKGNVTAADKLIALIIQAEGLEDERPPSRSLSNTDEQILTQFLGGGAADDNHDIEEDNDDEDSHPEPRNA